MRMTKFLNPAYVISCLLGFALIGQAHANTVVVEPIYDPYSNADLYVVEQGSWTQAEADAQSLGGNLVTIHSGAENAFIVNNILQDFSSVGGPNLSNLPLWIGLYDPTTGDGSGDQHAADFQWVDGSNSAYRNWNSGTGEPNNSDPGEYYTAINWHYALGIGDPGTWNDTPLDGTNGYGGNTDGPYYGIAAVSVPEPTSIGLLMIGSLSLGFVARRRVRVSSSMLGPGKSAAL